MAGTYLSVFAKVPAGKDDINGMYFFDRTFALVAYALAKEDGEQLKTLFDQADDDKESVTISFYEPIAHKALYNKVIFDMSTEWPKGPILQDFRSRW